jgi:hypothetical protein
VGTTAERLYVAFLAGDDLDDVMAQIGEERHARDPRRLFFLQDPRIAVMGQGKRSEPEPA